VSGHFWARSGRNRWHAIESHPSDNFFRVLTLCGRTIDLDERSRDELPDDKDDNWPRGYCWRCADAIAMASTTVRL
jgi:hypothetical protein